jgi:hypothetical protein
MARIHKLYNHPEEMLPRSTEVIQVTSIDELNTQMQRHLMDGWTVNSTSHDKLKTRKVVDEQPTLRTKCLPNDTVFFNYHWDYQDIHTVTFTKILTKTEVQRWKQFRAHGISEQYIDYKIRQWLIRGENLQYDPLTMQIDYGFYLRRILELCAYTGFKTYKCRSCDKWISK